MYFLAIFKSQDSFSSLKIIKISFKNSSIMKHYLSLPKRNITLKLSNILKIIFLIKIFSLPIFLTIFNSTLVSILFCLYFTYSLDLIIFKLSLIIFLFTPSVQSLSTFHSIHKLTFKIWSCTIWLFSSSMRDIIKKFTFIKTFLSR